MAEKLVEQDKFLEALKAYHSALSNRALPEGCAKSSVLNKMFRIISELNLECTSSADFKTVKLLLLCIEDCIFYANRDNIEGCDVTSFRHIYVMILLKVMQCKIDGKEAALCYGLVMKNVKSLETSLQTEYKTKAAKFLKRRRDQFSYSTNHKYSILELLECINTKADLLSSAKNIRRKKPQQGTVEYILYKLMLLGEKEVSDDFDEEDFELEFDKLRNKLGKLLTTKTGRVINLGNGLSAAHVLFVMMNYATPKTKSWNGSEWKYDTMKPTESCIGFWRKSVITCLEREVGIEKTAKHKSSCISTQDRLFWVCNTNKSDYDEEIDDVCEDADISEDTMHLIPIILLALKVKYARMNGHMPSILATGSPVRDNLFEVDDTLITRQAIFAGCVPHSELFTRKDRFLRSYPDIEVQHEYSQRLAVFYSQRFFTTSDCTFTENWTGLGNLSPKEMKEFREEHRRIMQEIGRRGGITTGELSQLASALHDVDWNHDDLSPVMQLRFAWSLEHKNRHKKKINMDELIEILEGMHDGSVEGKKAGVESHYQKNKDACHTWCRTTCPTYKQKESYFGHCAGKKHGGKKRDGSEIDRTAVTALMNSDDHPMKDRNAVSKCNESKRMTTLRKYADDPKKANFIMTRNRCLDCKQINPPAIVGLNYRCTTEDCEHCTIPMNKNDLTKGYKGVKIPKPENKVAKSDGVDRWEHVYTLSNVEKNKEIAKARAHEDVLRERKRQRKRQNKEESRRE